MGGGGDERKRKETFHKVENDVSPSSLGITTLVLLASVVCGEAAWWFPVAGPCSHCFHASSCHLTSDHLVIMWVYEVILLELVDLFTYKFGGFSGGVSSHILFPFSVPFSLCICLIQAFQRPALEVLVLHADSTLTPLACFSVHLWHFSAPGFLLFLYDFYFFLKSDFIFRGQESENRKSPFWMQSGLSQVAMATSLLVWLCSYIAFLCPGCNLKCSPEKAHGLQVRCQVMGFGDV